MCDLKGHISVFRLCEFSHALTDSNWETSQTKTKVHVKERRLEIIPGTCQAYAIGKQLIVSSDKTKSNNGTTNDQTPFRMLVACGRKLLLIEYNTASPPVSSSMTCLQQQQANIVCNSCNAALNNSSIANSLVQNPIIGVTQLTTTASGGMMNGGGCGGGGVTPSPLSSSASGQNLCGGGGDMPMMMMCDRNDITKMFQVKKEFTCSDVPNLINLMNSFSGENYILVSYKNKCELLSERNGECLKQFQFNSMSNIRSIVELYDNHKLEILVTYNCKS